MADTGCVLCGGSGFKQDPDSDSTVKQCVCAYARALKIHLGPEIALAKTLTQSPLYAIGGVDRTKDNLFLKGHWTHVLSHLKWALGCKGLNYRFRLTTDEKLKNVYVGAEAYNQKARNKREQGDSYNSLHDFALGDIELLIIRLGFLGHPNRAMAGLLKETLLMRESELRPTWIVDQPFNPFGPTHLSFSEELGDYIDGEFEQVGLVVHDVPAKDEIPVEALVPVLPEDGDVSLDLEPTVAHRVERVAPRAPAASNAPFREREKDRARPRWEEKRETGPAGLDLGIMGEGKKKGFRR